MLKERRLVRRLSVNMGLPILVRRFLYIETGPWYNCCYWHGGNTRPVPGQTVAMMEGGSASGITGRHHAQTQVDLASTRELGHSD